MKHKHCFAVKVNKKEDVGGNPVNSHGVRSKLNSGCDNVNPHMSDEVVGHMVVACFVCIFGIVCAHEVKKNTECSFGKQRNNVPEIAPEHDERSGCTDH